MKAVRILTYAALASVISVSALPSARAITMMANPVVSMASGVNPQAALSMPAQVPAMMMVLPWVATFGAPIPAPMPMWIPPFIAGPAGLALDATADQGGRYVHVGDYLLEQVQAGVWSENEAGLIMEELIEKAWARQVVDLRALDKKASRRAVLRELMQTNYISDVTAIFLASLLGINLG